MKPKPIAAAELSAADRGRFWSRVAFSPDCWEWTGGVMHGYGFFKLKGKLHRCPRVAYAICHGGVDDTLFVLHRCDNPLCVRPDHLFLGTHQEKAYDAKQKGRLATGDRNGARTHRGKLRQGVLDYLKRHPAAQKGVHNHNAKLTEHQVLEVRRRYAAGGVSQSALAREYGISQTGMSAVLRGTLWQHVTQERDE